MVTVLAYLMISHWAVLPHPSSADAAWESRIQQTQQMNNQQWTVIHFLYDNCACSRRVLEHVLGNSPIEGVTERVVLITESPASEVPRDGAIEFEVVTPSSLKDRYGIESAPLLVIVDDHQKVRYSGGYTVRKQGPEIKDREILASLISGDKVAELPLFGCAVSAELKKLVDPLGFKQ